MLLVLTRGWVALKHWRPLEDGTVSFADLCTGTSSGWIGTNADKEMLLSTSHRYFCAVIMPCHSYCYDYVYEHHRDCCQTPVTARTMFRATTKVRVFSDVPLRRLQLPLLLSLHYYSAVTTKTTFDTRTQAPFRSERVLRT